MKNVDETKIIKRKIVDFTDEKKEESNCNKVKSFL